MTNASDPPIDIGRRDALKTMGAGALVASTGAGALGSIPALAASAASRHEPRAQRSAAYNILFILTDQERFFRPGELPQGYRLPAHERLAKSGITFENHQINSCVCTPSRSVL